MRRLKACLAGSYGGDGLDAQLFSTHKHEHTTTRAGMQDRQTHELFEKARQDGFAG